MNDLPWLSDVLRGIEARIPSHDIHGKSRHALHLKPASNDFVIRVALPGGQSFCDCELEISDFHRESRFVVDDIVEMALGPVGGRA